MNILVCIKQVPDTTEIKINPETNTLIREGVPSIVNTFDTFALETAARIKDVNNGSKIVVITMGPEQAKNALKECLAVGADKAYLINDRAFGGSDTLATGYVLSKALAKVEEFEGKFDIIFCGKQAIDGDTAQVGPELAENLDYPQVTYAVDASVEGSNLRVKKECDIGYEVLDVSMPCVVTVTKPAYEPRYPSIKSKMTANRTDIPVLTSEDFDVDILYAGLKGSPTKVKKTFVPTVAKNNIIIKEETCEASSKKLIKLLSDAAIL